jgi:hypothetical protein
VEVRFGVELLDEISMFFRTSWEQFFAVPLRCLEPALEVSHGSDLATQHSYLVEVLQEIHYPSGDLILRQTSACGIASYSLEVCGGGDLLRLEERASRDRASH